MRLYVKESAMKDPGSFLTGCVCIVIALGIFGFAHNILKGGALLLLPGVIAAIVLVIGIVLVRGGFK